jgi:predicted ABC-type ATPase
VRWNNVIEEEVSLKIYTIIGGVNGAGKSSLSGVLTAESSELGIIIDTDKMTAELGGDRIKGGKAAIALIDDCLKKRINFTQETTLSGVRTLKTIQRARELDYYIRLYYVGVSSSAESIKRIKNRVEKGGHDIPSEDVERRYTKRFDDLAKVLPYCNEVRFFDNENGFAEKAEYRNGQLITKGSNIPQWLTDLKEYLDK